MEQNEKFYLNEEAATIMDETADKYYPIVWKVTAGVMSFIAFAMLSAFVKSEKAKKQAAKLAALAAKKKSCKCPLRFF